MAHAVEILLHPREVAVQKPFVKHSQCQILKMTWRQAQGISNYNINNVSRNIPILATDDLGPYY